MKSDSFTFDNNVCFPEVALLSPYLKYFVRVPAMNYIYLHTHTQQLKNRGFSLESCVYIIKRRCFLKLGVDGVLQKTWDSFSSPCVSRYVLKNANFKHL